jgi:hypothetical protein
MVAVKYTCHSRTAKTPYAPEHVHVGITPGLTRKIIQERPKNKIEKSYAIAVKATVYFLQ